MNARDEILARYDVNAHGTIISPGKFEGEPLYVPYFWGHYLDGCADRDDGRVLGFDIDRVDRELFPEIPKRQRTIRLVEIDQGFVQEI